MTQPYAPVRFDVARVISRMTGVVSRNPGVFLGLAASLTGLPTLALALLQLVPGLSERMGQLNSLTGLFSLFLSPMLEAALIHATVSDLNGVRPNVGDCLNTAIRNVLPLIGIGVISTVATARASCCSSRRASSSFWRSMWRPRRRWWKAMACSRRWDAAGTSPADIAAPSC
jgi:hypothetical protein